MTKNIYAMMLNQKPAMGLPTAPKPTVKPPGVMAPGVKVQKSPQPREFAYTGSPSTMYRNPMMGRGNDIALGLWGKALSRRNNG